MPTRLRAHLGLIPREALGQGMGLLTAWAAHLMRALAGRYQRDQSVIEVYPKASIVQLGVPGLGRAQGAGENHRAERVDLVPGL